MTGEHGEEWKAVDEALQEECSQVTYSPNGMCPCCGAEIEHEVTGYNGVRDITEYVQFCPSCNWESELLYDA